MLELGTFFKVFIHFGDEVTYGSIHIANLTVCTNKSINNERLRQNGNGSLHENLLLILNGVSTTLATLTTLFAV